MKNFLSQSVFFIREYAPAFGTMAVVFGLGWLIGQNGICR